MFGYYFKLGVRSLRRNPALTALMVLTLAVGVAASVATLTILHVMSGDPIPSKSDRLFVPLVDNNQPKGYTPGDKLNDDQSSYKDAIAILNARVGVRRVIMYGFGPSVEPPRAELGAFNVSGIAPTADFFAMFEVPFLYGQGWGEAEDKAGADVVVLGRELAEKVFGNTNPVGQTLRLMGFPYKVIGVIDYWNPLPHYHHIIGGPGSFGKPDDLFIPFNSAIRHETSHSGSMSCDGNRDPGFQGLLNSECTWIQPWIETRSASERVDVHAWLDNYANEQRKLGRLQRKAPNYVWNVMEWLEYRKVVGNDSKLQAWLAFGFLILCLVNTIGLLLAKFSVRASEVGVRRALGASRREIFNQFLIETAVVGLAGGVLGLLLAFGALALIAMQSNAMSVVAHMDWAMLATTFIMSVAAAILAGLLPTWRACQVTPALQLKSQ
ncbi:ABC transporter permease [Massilia arenosa]|uniref:ABC transporter permease n=1 Tax=Zemynaea arenosa TaxID=2561931 RepID=A0A4Y9S145_9BURK|nr:ABC transporter permease [Massilia arenosa]TFW13685.1 ABC transporter permease [Massilia arenosa]